MTIDPTVIYLHLTAVYVLGFERLRTHYGQAYAFAARGLFQTKPDTKPTNLWTSSDNAPEQDNAG